MHNFSSDFANNQTNTKTHYPVEITYKNISALLLNRIKVLWFIPPYVH